MKLSIGFKISFVIMLFLIVEVSVGFILLKKSTESTLKSIISEEFSQTINVIENTFSFMEQSNIYMADSLLSNKKDLKDINLKREIKRLKVDSIILVDKDANIVSQAGLFSVDAQNLRSYYIVHEAMKQKSPLSAIERVGDIFVFYTSYPIMKDKTILGEVLIGLQISNKVLAQMKMGSSIELAIVGDRAIAASSLQLKNAQPFVLLPVDYITYLMLLNNKVDFLLTKVEGTEYFIKAKELKYVDEDVTNASLMLMYDTKKYNEQLSEIKNIQFFIIVAILITFLLILMLLSSYLKRNFSKLINGLKRISDGKYGDKVTINSNDELETLANYFNQMSHSIEDKDTKIKQQVLDLENKIKSINQLEEKEKILYKQATEDFLTGLYNRDKFKTLFNYMLNTSKRENKKLAFAIVDIDFFKNVNDTYGHLVGDDVLKTLSTILKDNIRESDIVARWGGEEFVIAMLVHDQSEAKFLLEKLRLLIENHKFDMIDELTCSFGTSISKPNEDKDILFKRADDALYEAKANGRNRVEVKF